MMGLFGPSVQEMTKAVKDGIWESIKTTTSKRYELAIGKIEFSGDVLYLPEIPEVTLSNFNDPQPTMPEPKKIIKRVNDLIFVVRYAVYETTRNPFQDTTKTEKIKDDLVATLYQHDGWTEKKVRSLMYESERQGFWLGPLDKHKGSD